MQTWIGWVMVTLGAGWLVLITVAVAMAKDPEAIVWGYVGLAVTGPPALILAGIGATLIFLGRRSRARDSAAGQGRGSAGKA